MRSAVSAALLVVAGGLLAGAALGADKGAAGKESPLAKAPVVLHVGDSFLGSGFAQALKPRFQALGAKYVAVVQTSAYTTTLPRQVRLDALLATHKPVLVLLTVGANEMRMPRPEDHAPAVKRLSQMAGASACIWALPPRWDDKETGILGIMRRDAGPCRVYDPTSIAPTIPRAGDKMHPSLKGGAMWADAFWSWLMAGRAPGEMPWDPPRAAPGPSASVAPSASVSP